MRQHRLRGQIVVLTGASSGIGRVTAVEFARRGANVVLGARDESALEDVARACQAQGVAALAVPIDTRVSETVELLAEQALHRFGRIDVWVNNAAVAIFGRLLEIPLEEFRRVIETNLMGYVHGARAVWPTFLRQRQGVLINNASMLGKLSVPYASAYVASKHAIRGLGMCLRQELEQDSQEGVHVCTVMPATIDTPIFQHAGNYSGRAVLAMPPVYRPERVARTIVRLAHSPKREVFVGNSARLFAAQSLLAPGLTERLLALLTDHLQLSRTRTAEPTAGNLFQPQPEPTVHGGWRKENRKLLPAAALVGLLAVPAVWALLRQ